MSDRRRSDPEPRLIDWARNRWRDANLTQRRLVFLLAIWIGLVVGAYLVASWVWHEDLARSTITTVTLVLMALAALLLFGAKGSKTLVTVLAAGVTIGAVGGGALDSDRLLPEGPPPQGAVVGCPEPSSDYAFDGVVASTDLGYTHLREEPNLHSRIELRYPAGCEVRFSGYCFGEPKVDWRFDTPDPVWFELADEGGYIASADLSSAPPPQGVPPGDCPTGKPPPQAAELTAPLSPHLSGPVEIAAAAPDSVIVGFAAHYEDTPGEQATARWHQIGLDTDTGDGITASWDTRSVPGQSRELAAPATIAVVSCQGLEFPVEGVGVRPYAVSNRARFAARNLTLEPAPIADAPEVACANPDR